jgi:hypothetical protein
MSPKLQRLLLRSLTGAIFPSLALATYAFFASGFQVGPLLGGFFFGAAFWAVGLILFGAAAVIRNMFPD